MNFALFDQRSSSQSSPKVNDWRKNVFKSPSQKPGNEPFFTSRQRSFDTEEQKKKNMTMTSRDLIRQSELPKKEPARDYSSKINANRIWGLDTFFVPNSLKSAKLLYNK